MGWDGECGDVEGWTAEKQKEVLQMRGAFLNGRTALGLHKSVSNPSIPADDKSARQAWLRLVGYLHAR